MSRTIIDYFILEYHPDHPRAEGEGWVPQHILVMEAELGRLLTQDEDVKHSDGNPHNNHIENLRLVTPHVVNKTSSILDSQEAARRLSRTFIPCKFQKECWKTVRAPIVRKHKVYLPYICSYQTEGDIYKCGHYWDFKNVEIKKGEMSNDFSTNRPR